MALTLSVSIFLNVILLVHFFITYQLKVPFYTGERYIFRGKIIQITTVHRTKELVLYEYGTISFKVLKEEGIPYTEEAWENFLEEKKIKEELKGTK